MNKPLYAENYKALEYTYLFKDANNINFYSAKINDDEYVMTDDYDSINYDIYSEEPIILLNDNRLLCKHESKYGVVDLEGWEIIPFVYDKFEKEIEQEEKYNVLLGHRWGVIDLSGNEIFSIKYKNPIYGESSHEIFGENLILVENADTNRKGLVDFSGNEIIPTIYSKIEHCENSGYIYVNLGGKEEIEPDCLKNGLWGCYNLQGIEIIPVKFHAIHYINGYFIVGDDENIQINYNEFSNIYYGLYDLYDTEGNMIIGGFNNCQIGTNHFILNFGISFEPCYKTSYYNGIEYDKLVKEIHCDKMYSIIVNKDLISFISRHLIEETHDEIIFEYNILNNMLPAKEGLLIGECPQLCMGKKYGYNDKIIKGISVNYASSINDNIVKYSSNKKITKEDGSIIFLKGIIFCDNSTVVEPTYLDVESINDKLVLIQDKNDLVGIRNATKELLIPEFDLITNKYNNIAIGFKIEHIEDEKYQCKCYLLKFYEDTIKKEYLIEIDGDLLYDLLYNTIDSLDNWNNFDLGEKRKTLIVQYWNYICRNNFNGDCFWYPAYRDFKYLEKTYYDKELNENIFDESNDLYDWQYYNDGLDMDQQDERFWDF